MEVELRAFIDANQYGDLLQRLRREGVETEHTRQITHYLETEVDTRIQFSTTGGRVWQKLGRMHDTARKELEVITSTADAKVLLQIFLNLGYDIKVTWYRERRTFRVSELQVMLDDTVGYGQIIEVEVLSEESAVEANRQRLRDYLTVLGIEPTCREIFDNAYSEYLRSWRSKTATLGNHWIEEIEASPR